MRNSTLALIIVAIIVVLGLGYFVFALPQANNANTGGTTTGQYGQPAQTDTTGSDTGIITTTTTTVTSSSTGSGTNASTSTTVSSNVAGPGQHCGGNTTNAKTCSAGYTCKPTPGSNLPFGDVGGTCQ